MATECALTIDFGTAGNRLSYIGDGWAPAEPEFTWGVGAESQIALPRPEDADAYVLTLDLVPFVRPPTLPAQRLVVSINGTVVGSSELSRPTLLGFCFSGAMVGASERVVITLQHPDAAQPANFPGSADTRHLAFAVSEAKLYRLTDTADSAPYTPTTGPLLSPPKLPLSDAGALTDLTKWAVQQTGMSLPQIALRFESLGENCEFGLFQRRCDSEPLGLLRFSSTFVRNLIRGIDSRFEGLGAVEDVDPRLEGGKRREYMIHEKKYGLVYHTFIYEGQRSIWLVREQESARLKFLLRKFMEDLQNAEKIFVYKRNTTVFEEEVLPLRMALNRYGDNTLLWVVPAKPDRPDGTVEVIMPGLLKGYIDYFAPDDDAHSFSFEGWLRICANACLLARSQDQKPALSKA